MECEYMRLGILPKRDPNESWEQKQKLRVSFDGVGETMMNMMLLSNLGHPYCGVIDDKVIDIESHQ